MLHWAHFEKRSGSRTVPSFVLAEERYDVLLKAYNLPVEGDTAAKREALRIFMGLPE